MTVEELIEGGLYNVVGLHVYGAGDTAWKAIEEWNQIMYVQKEILIAF